MKKSSKQHFPIVIFFLSIFIGLTFCILVFYNNSHIKKINLNDFSTDNTTFKYEITEIQENNYSIGINGYAFIPNEDMEYFNTRIILKDTSTNKAYLLKTTYQQRKDISTLYGNEFNYDNCGFYARFLKLSLKNGHTYTVYISYQTSDKKLLVNTGESITLK